MAGSSSSTEVDVGKADKLMAEGKRNLICNNPHVALECFSLACELFSLKYGQTGDKMADPYLYYGKALLDVARSENGVLGNAVKEKESMEEDKEEEDVEVDVAGGESKAACGATIAEAQDEGEDAAEDDDEDEEEDDVTNMQLAWEMFELSASIFQKMGPEYEEKLAEIKQELGQVGLETEQYDQAVMDLSEAYEIQKRVLPSDDRRIAESSYSVGLALAFDKKYAESTTWFKRAIECLQTRLQFYKDKVKTLENEGNKGKASTDLEDANKEVAELNELIAEMMAKIEDNDASLKQFNESLAMMKNTAKDFFTQASTVFDSGFGTSPFDSEFGGSSGTSSNGLSSNSAFEISATNGFDSSTTNGFGSASSTLDEKPVSTGLIIKKKQKYDGSGAESESKKLKTDDTACPSEAATVTSPEK